MVERYKRKSEGGNYFGAPKSQLRFIPTGSKLLDMALGGGWAEGRIANVVGDKSSGKTLLCIEAAANFAKTRKRGKVYYREAEAAFDKEYAGALGMPLDRVDFGKQDSLVETVEDLFDDMSDILKRDEDPCLYILDSLDSLSDRAEMARDLDEGTYGTGKAKKLSEFFRRNVRKMEDAGMTMIVVSQVRDKIGPSFGGETTKRSGGRALDFYASQVLWLTQLGQVKKTVKGITRTVAVEVRGKVKKNKIALPFREAQFEIRFGFGVDDLTACLNWLGEAGYLDDVDVQKTKIKEFVRSLDKAPDEEYWSVVREVQEAVEKRWYEVEQRFLPTRRKYA